MDQKTDIKLLLSLTQHLTNERKRQVSDRLIQTNNEDSLKDLSTQRTAMGQQKYILQLKSFRNLNHSYSFCKEDPFLSGMTNNLNSNGTKQNDTTAWYVTICQFKKFP